MAARSGSRSGSSAISNGSTLSRRQVEIHVDDRKRGGRDARNAPGLAERYGPYALEFLDDLVREARQALKREVRRNAPALGALELLDVALLLGEVALVLDLGLDGLEIEPRQPIAEVPAQNRRERFDGDIRALQKLGQRGAFAGRPVRAQERAHARHAVLLGRETLPI